MTIGQRIAERRKTIGLTQDELAKKLNITKSAVCKVEKGDDNITLDTIERYAAALKCKPADLMGWTSVENVTQVKDNQIARLISYFNQIQSESEKETVLKLLEGFSNH